MALESIISRADLGAYLRRDLSADDLALIAINAASQIVRTRTRQTLSLVEDETFIYGIRSTPADLLLPELPVVEIDEVRVDDEVELEWEVSENGILHLSGATYASTVEVDYSHGYETVPDDLRLVALTVAARIYEQGTARQESTGSSSITFSVAASTDLSSGEKAICDSYRVIKRSGIAAMGVASTPDEETATSSALRSVRSVDADTTVTADDDIIEVDASGFTPEVPGSDEFQQVIENTDVGPSPSGTYTVTINGETTPPIALNSSNEDLRTAYATLPSVELDVNLFVDGAGTHTLHFTGAWGEQDVPEVTVDPSGLVDADVFVSVAQEGFPGTPGSGDDSISVTLPADADEPIPVGFEVELWVAVRGDAAVVVTTAEGVLVRGYDEPTPVESQIQISNAMRARKVDTDLWTLSRFTVYIPGD